MTEVSIVRRENEVLDDEKIYQMVKEAVELIGGWKNVIKKGDRVLIKPNLVRPAPPPTTTDPRVTAALCRLCFEAGAGEVIVGEDTATMTHWWREGMNTRKCFELTGMQEAVEKVGAKILPFDEDEFPIVEIPGALTLRKGGIAKACLEADVIIPNPVMKCSLEGTATLNLKDLHGVTEPYITRLQYHRQDLHQKLVDVNKFLRDKIKLAVIDAITPMEGYGPIYGTAIEGFNTIIASNDPVAGDTVGCAVMGIDPYQHDMVRLANHQGVGVGELNKISIKGVPLKEFTHKFADWYPHVKGAFKNVEVIEGGVCRSCRAWIMFTLLALKGKYKDLGETIEKSVGKLYILTGIEPPLPDKMRDFKGKVVVFGDCAIATCKKVKRELESEAAYVLGCPPFEIGPVVRQIKEAMDLKITGKEAYEGYGLGKSKK